MSEFKLPNGSMTSIELIETDVLLVEYNAKRYFQYVSLFSKEQNNIRSMKISPMYKFILEYTICGIGGKKFDYVNTKYYEMQRAYGRSHSQAMVKMSNFIKLFRDIRINGLNKIPFIIPDGNGLYQIKDGHHRIACCMVLNKKKVPCRILREKIIN
ncbi:hypothetical protein LCGC14_1883890 [marine sediment metagenome]|uniref:Uncharacterized protein n=1 Tax=marine sediment metagenome TaxID=412755 RepID=A0A0F9IZR4_9ZZZZ